MLCNLPARINDVQLTEELNRHGDVKKIKFFFPTNDRESTILIKYSTIRLAGKALAKLHLQNPFNHAISLRCYMVKQHNKIMICAYTGHLDETDIYEKLREFIFGSPRLTMLTSDFGYNFLGLEFEHFTYCTVPFLKMTCVGTKINGRNFKASLVDNFPSCFN